MAEVLFYHLTDDTFDQVLPNLIARSRERGWRVVVRGGSDERIAALDSLLWTYSEESFLAHGLASDPHPETQPVLLTTDDARPNAAEVLFLLDSAPLPEDWSGLTRVVVMFPENDNEAKQFARGQWKIIRDSEHEGTYWQQDETGRWIKKA